MDIRTTSLSDHSQIDNVIKAAFDSSAEASLVKALRKDGDVIISLVAILEGVVAGHIVLSKMNGPVRALGLAPVSVIPKYQRKGIGGKLILSALEMAKLDAWQAVFLLGHTHYYSRFGFSTALAQPFTSPYAGPNFMAIELQDGALTGKSGPIEYAPAFSAL